MSRILAVNAEHPDASVIADASKVVLNGGLIVYPTETLYGIGADGTNPSAIRKVQRAKQRVENKPILLIVGSIEMLKPLVVEVTPSARLLINTFWPGPLTMVFRASAMVPPELTLGTGTIGIRIPSSAFCLALLARVNIPLTSTSANLSGEEPARKVDQIEQQLTGIDVFLDAGTLPESKPSTVLDVTASKPRILRQGAISFAQLKMIIPDLQQSHTIT